MSKFQLMRLWFALILACAFSGSPILAQESTSTIPPAAAESGKDVVHALNNAFAKVFEIVAPSVVIIEVSKKNDGNEGLNFDDLFSPGGPSWVAVSGFIFCSPHVSDTKPPLPETVRGRK